MVLKVILKNDTARGRCHSKKDIVLAGDHWSVSESNVRCSLLPPYTKIVNLMDQTDQVYLNNIRSFISKRVMSLLHLEPG